MAGEEVVARAVQADVLQVVQPQWELDPTQWSLGQSAWRPPEVLPVSFCPEVGRRMLLAQLEYSEWVLRRVEKVQFERDRSVSREIAIELKIRADAPVFVDEGGEEFWLVPLSSMRRRTLVNLALRSENDEAITLPGIRLTQQLDQAMLMAAAATQPMAREDEGAAREFIQRYVAGTFDQVIEAIAEYAGKRGDHAGYLEALAANPAFDAAFSLLHRNFTLYLFLPRSAGRHRLIHMSFDEPTDWRYRTSRLEEVSDGAWEYEAAPHITRWYEPSHLLAAVALKPTRLRLQVPGAEKAASYHFEIVAPHGLRIVGATLLAGRPNDPERHVSEDHVSGHAPTVGLHAVEIPNGSLCRVQVDFRVPSRGWLTAMVISCAVVFGVILSVLYHLTVHVLPWNDGQVTNVVVLLITTSAGVATLIAQREFSGVADRMVGQLRALGALSTSLPIFAAGFLAYMTLPATGSELNVVRAAIIVLTALAFVALVIAALAWELSRRGGHYSVVQESPWDMTIDKQRNRAMTNFSEALLKYEFDSPAVSIRSAEGWHEHYRWTDERQRMVTRMLARLGHPPVDGHFAACRLAEPDSAGCSCASP
jgi:hypothetical protein